jgi:DNA-directed RNA polymerase specialized sigma24 family protein
VEKPLTHPAIWEAQAAACLRAADTHRTALLRLARGLAGSAEDGMDLYQQTLLNCHDAIQRKGFAGTNYVAYLYQAIRQTQYRRNAAARRLTGLPDHYDAALAAEPDGEARQQFAEQVAAGARELFPVRDRVVLRLHLEATATSPASSEATLRG